MEGYPQLYAELQPDLAALVLSGSVSPRFGSITNSHIQQERQSRRSQITRDNASATVMGLRDLALYASLNQR